MTEKTSNQPPFIEWIDRHDDPGWKLMPLTHISKGIDADKIVRAGKVSISDCKVFSEPLAYFFYGRPAYRVTGDGVVKFEAACPFCFIFEPNLIKRAKTVHAFDTGAFSNRMYSHALMNEMAISDFSLGTDTSRPNRIISATFSTPQAYFDGDSAQITSAVDGAEPWEFHARAYLNLLSSNGRNEPDDRICSIEAIFDQDIELAEHLKAVVVPHTLWDGTKKAPWLQNLSDVGIEIVPYLYIPGRHPEHYHALLEIQVRALYANWGIL